MRINSKNMFKSIITTEKRLNAIEKRIFFKEQRLLQSQQNSINFMKFFDAIKPILQNNPRQIQKDNGRKIFYNTNTNDKNKRNYGDRLRCYTDQEFRKACSCLSGQKDIVEAKNKQALLLMAVVILVTLFVLLVLYLIQENFIGKSLSNVFKTPLFLPTKAK